MLADRGLYGLTLKPRPSLLKMELTKKKVSRTEIMNFSRQLAAFVRAGIPLIDAVDVLRAEVKSDRFRAVLGRHRRGAAGRRDAFRSRRTARRRVP